MSELQERAVAEIRAWAADNPFADSDEVADAIADLVERTVADSQQVTQLEERIWAEWRRIEDERAGQYGA